MKVLGIGVDIVHLPRIKSLLLREPNRFLTRVLTEYELKEAKALQELAKGDVHNDALVNFVGARWAVKEACYKAAFPQKLTYQDVSVFKKEGKPYLDIREKHYFGIANSHVSISHDGEYLIGQVVFETSFFHKIFSKII